MSRGETFRLLDKTTLDLTETDSDTSLAIAAITEVSITPSVSIEHLYTADSIKAVDRMQHSFQGDITIGHARFDGDIAKQWLAGSGGSTATSITDTSDPQTFEVAGTFESADGANQIDVTVTDITFESMPVFDGSMDDWYTRNLEGTFEDITNYDVAAVV